MLKTVRWILVPFAAVFGLALSVALAIPLNRLVHTVLWSRGHAMPGKEFLAYVERYDGAMAAALFILFGYIAAPSRRLLVACTLFVIGGVLAWMEVGHSYSSIRTPEPVRLWGPLLGTVTGGVITLALLCMYSVTRAHLTRR